MGESSDPPGHDPGAPGERGPGSDEGGLAAVGWDERTAAAFERASSPVDEPGRVARVDRGAVTALTREGPARAGLGVALRDSPAEDLPAVGDWVVLHPAEVGGLEVVAVLPRRSAFVRGDPRGRGGQVVAANVDTVLVVHGLDRGPNLRRLERELVLAWESGATPVVVCNKADLVSSPAGAVEAVEAIAPGVPVHAVSCVTGAGLEGLRAYGRGHRSVALIGPSGAGKSTLVNRLVGDDVQATGDVRAGDLRGRHTTSVRELVPLPGGGVLVDTPGLRAVGMWDAEEGLSRAFVDVEDLAARCRFRDCRHESEPGCAVLAAVASGELDPDRLDSYRRLERELDEAAAARAEGHARAERRRRERVEGRHRAAFVRRREP